MLKKKCPACEKRIDRSFNFCPHCGTNFRRNDKEDFGLLGRNDLIPSGNEMKIPSGIEKMMNSLVRQLERQMNNLNFENVKKPVGIQVKFSTSNPKQNFQKQILERDTERETDSKISQKEMERRNSLPKIEAESTIKRLADRIIYILNTPGVREKKDVVITALASGIEIKAYSKNKCYVKYIPMTVEIIGYRLNDEKLFVEIKA